MRYDDFSKIILDSAAADWRGVKGPVPPQYIHGLHEERGLDSGQYEYLWVLADDIRIGIACGMDWASDRRLSFPGFPPPDAAFMDGEITSSYAELRYDGNPISRVPLISVDSGRGILPTPGNEVVPDAALEAVVFAHSAPEFEVRVARLISGLLRKDEFEGYLRRSGIVALPDEDPQPQATTE